MDWTGRSTLWQACSKLALAAVIAATGPIGPALARGSVAAGDSVALLELPREAQQTEKLIRAGGPFPYAKDGVAFGNRERLLPRRERGYYREYTVPTPGARSRGAKRIVCGGPKPREPDACYYTDDHYASFRRIVH